jgi:hydroxymethylbilane synthase
MTAAPGATGIASGETTDHRPLPRRVGTRGSPLALVQARVFMQVMCEAFPGLQGADALQEHVITTTGDTVQDRRLADIGGKGLFAKEIHEALVGRRIDFAVHSLKDLETDLPKGVVLACTLPREDPRDALILSDRCGEPDPSDPLAALSKGAVVGTSSVRRQAQLLHARPDLIVVTLRGNVQTRLAKLRDGQCDTTVLALAGLNRLGLVVPRTIVLSPDQMVPAACQGIIGITIRADDTRARDMLAKIEDPETRAIATAERSLLAELDGSCRTPIGAYAHMRDDGRLSLTGTVARTDGSFLLTRSLTGRPVDAARIGQTLATSLRVDAPADIFD